MNEEDLDEKFDHRIAYKLMRIKSDDSIGSLFINRKANYEMGVIYSSELHPTKGFATRLGFHTMAKPYAPHLKMVLANGEIRHWYQVKIWGFESFERPLSQGGVWFLSEYMKIIEQLLPWKC